MVSLITRIGLHLLVLGAGIIAGCLLGEKWDPNGDYAYAEGVQRHYRGHRRLAYTTWQRAAAQGHPGAYYCMGAYQAHRLVDDAKAEVAFFYYNIAAQRGQPHAQYEVGRALELGKGLQPHLKSAIIWYEKAAQQDHAEACFRLGKLYRQGKGVEQDYSRAVYWFRRAAEQRHADAMLSLSFIYQYYKPLRDTAKAERLLRDAAGLGQPFANTILRNGGF